VGVEMRIRRLSPLLLFMLVLLIQTRSHVVAVPAFSTGQYAIYEGSGMIKHTVFEDGMNYTTVYMLEFYGKVEILDIDSEVVTINESVVRYGNTTYYYDGNSYGYPEVEIENRIYDVKLSDRKILSGELAGNYTFLWIPTDVSVGDKVIIIDEEARVKSVSATYTPACEGYGTRDVIVVEFNETFSIRDIIVYTLYYDKETGFLLGVKITFDGGEGEIEISLVDTDVPKTPMQVGGGTATEEKEGGEAAGPQINMYLVGGAVAAVCIIGIVVIFMMKRRPGA